MSVVLPVMEIDHQGIVASRPLRRRLGSLFIRAMLTALLLTTACSGPTLLLPGGRLEGGVAETPENWAFTDEISTIQIETRPEDPYSVNIWAVGMGDYLYLHAGGNRTTWIEHFEINPAARARVDGTIYELVASRVEDEAEFARFADAYEAKYGVRPRNENLPEIYVYRLGAR